MVVIVSVNIFFKWFSLLSPLAEVTFDMETESCDLYFDQWPFSAIAAIFILEIIRKGVKWRIDVNKQIFVLLHSNNHCFISKVVLWHLTEEVKLETNVEIRPRSHTIGERWGQFCTRESKTVFIYFTEKNNRGTGSKKTTSSLLNSFVMVDDSEPTHEKRKLSKTYKK